MAGIGSSWEDLYNSDKGLKYGNFISEAGSIRSNRSPCYTMLISVYRVGYQPSVISLQNLKFKLARET